MSGHSKWSTIKRDKEKTDQARGKIFTKIGKEIAVAVKAGGPDPATNPKLATVIAKARSNNMPNDNIQRSIKKASGEASNVNYEEMTYEGYGPGGSAVICEILTDNKNRASSDVRHIFDRAGGALGGPGSVAFMFDRKAVIATKAKQGLSEDDVMMLAMDIEADDVDIAPEGYTFVGEATKLATMRDKLLENGLEVVSAELEMIPNNTMDLPEDKYISFMKMLDNLEENDDVQNVFHNVNLREE